MLSYFINEAKADSKTITMNPDQGTLTVEQHSSTGVGVGGVTVDTGHWIVDALGVLVLVALVYIGKKYIDKWFAKKVKTNGEVK